MCAQHLWTSPSVSIPSQGWVDEGDEAFDGEDDDDDPHAHDEIVDEDEEELERAGMSGVWGCV